MSVNKACKFILLLLLCVSVDAIGGLGLAAGATGASGQSGSEGRAIYEARCAWCHDSEGTGYGIAAKYLNPPPRDFSLGTFKWKRSAFGTGLPTKEDLHAFIAGLSDDSSHWSGITGTSMPGWDSILSNSEIEAVADYVLKLAYIDGPLPAETVDLSGRVTSTDKSVASGKKLFRNRCSECHGMYGRGNSSKRLKDDLGERTWARNLTKPWLFRTGAKVDDIFTRISLGIEGTQMPAFADPKSRKSLSESERWDVANYVVTLAQPYKEPVPGTVIEAVKITGALPESPVAPEWSRAEYASLYIFPQIITKERLFTPSLDSVSVKVLYNRESVAMLIEWDDPTESLPGDRDSEVIAGGRVYVDAAAVQFPSEPLSDGRSGETFSGTPYFGMGDIKKPVDIWFWQGPGKGTGDGVRFIEAEGVGSLNFVGAGEAGLSGVGLYDEGTWRVLVTRSLTEWEQAVESIASGATVPVAFAFWDGSNSEFGSKHTMTVWSSLAFEAERDMMVYILPAFIFILVLGVEIVWLCNVGKG